MKQKIKRIAALAVPVRIPAAAAAGCIWNREQMKALRTELTAEYEKEKRPEDRIAAIRAESDSPEKQNQSRSSQIQKLIKALPDVKSRCKIGFRKAA